jgi:hypothetical protein
MDYSEGLQKIQKRLMLKLKKNILIYDRHYINIITLIALEAGYIECATSEKCFIGIRTPKSDEFLCLGSEKKLLRLLEAAVALCSKMIIQITLI